MSDFNEYNWGLSENNYTNTDKEKLDGIDLYVLSKEKYNPYHISDEEPNLQAGEVWI